MQSGAGDTYMPVFSALFSHLCPDLVQASLQMPSCPPLPNPLSTPLLSEDTNLTTLLPLWNLRGSPLPLGKVQIASVGLQGPFPFISQPLLPRQGPSTLATSFSGQIFFSSLMLSLRQRPRTLNFILTLLFLP